MRTDQTTRQVPQSLQQIRRHPRSIGGYANVFGILISVSLGRTGGTDAVVRRGAFRVPLATGTSSLLHNHDRSVCLASTAADTLHLEEDAYGLWVEAILPDTEQGRRLAQLASLRRLTGMSLGSTGLEGFFTIGGIQTFDSMALWEVSVLSGDTRPGCRQTWCLPNAHARDKRQRILQHPRVQR